MEILPDGWSQCHTCGVTYSSRYTTCPKCEYIAIHGQPEIVRYVNSHRWTWDNSLMQWNKSMLRGED